MCDITSRTVITDKSLCGLSHFDQRILHGWSSLGLPEPCFAGEQDVHQRSGAARNRGRLRLLCPIAARRFGARCCWSNTLPAPIVSPRARRRGPRGCSRCRFTITELGVPARARPQPTSEHGPRLEVIQPCAAPGSAEAEAGRSRRRASRAAAALGSRRYLDPSASDPSSGGAGVEVCREWLSPLDGSPISG